MNKLTEYTCCVITRDATGDSHAFLVNRDNTQRMRIDPFGGIFIGDTADDLTNANAKISLIADGSAEFAGDVQATDGSGGITRLNPLGQLFIQSNTGVAFDIRSAIDTSVSMFQVSGADGEIVSKSGATFAGSITAAGVVNAATIKPGTYIDLSSLPVLT